MCSSADSSSASDATKVLKRTMEVFNAFGLDYESFLSDMKQREERLLKFLDSLKSPRK